MQFENTEVWGFEHAIRGMRNPMNSRNQSDSCTKLMNETDIEFGYEPNYEFVIGENDMKLAQKLIKAGSEHRKFMRQIFVSVDITAPLYWWKEFDTYKIGTVANSTSTMHKLATTPITLDCFEIDDCENLTDDKFSLMLPLKDEGEFFCYGIGNYICFLEELRLKYIQTKDKRYWKELIRWLPESWLQTRTVIMNYENIFSMVHQRNNHKLNEWSGKDNANLPNFIVWAKSLPYSDEFIFGKDKG